MRLGALSLCICLPPIAIGRPLFWARVDSRNPSSPPPDPFHDLEMISLGGMIGALLAKAWPQGGQRGG